MPLPIHDALASTVNLAKSWLLTIDRTKEETTVPTETLRLWLETLVGLASPRVSDLSERADKTVLGHLTAFKEAHRTEAELQAARASKNY